MDTPKLVHNSRELEDLPTKSIVLTPQDVCWRMVFRNHSGEARWFDARPPWHGYGTQRGRWECEGRPSTTFITNDRHLFPMTVLYVPPPPPEPEHHCCCHCTCKDS